MSNTPRYVGFLDPPYNVILQNDSGAALNLTGVVSSNFSMVMVNINDPTQSKTTSGTWTVTDAVNGKTSYQWLAQDLNTSGPWQLYVSVKLPGETSTREFDPDPLFILPTPTGGTPAMTTQDVNLAQVNGTTVSSANPVPTSGPVTIADGAAVTLGTTTDPSTANTAIGLLKALKLYLAGTLTASLSGALPAMPTSATGTLTSVVAVASNTQILASNTSRKGMYVYNDSTAIMYLAFNATASTTSYTVQVPANGFFEMPIAPTYTGQINAVWSSTTGNARITELS